MSIMHVILHMHTNAISFFSDDHVEVSLWVCQNRQLNPSIASNDVSNGHCLVWFNSQEVIKSVVGFIWVRVAVIMSPEQLETLLASLHSIALLLSLLPSVISLLSSLLLSMVEECLINSKKRDKCLIHFVWSTANMCLILHWLNTLLQKGLSYSVKW